MKIKKQQSERFKEFIEELKKNNDKIKEVLVSEQFMENELGKGCTPGITINFDMETEEGKFESIEALVVKDYRIKYKE